jgi:antitoxin (DNA-binding transcriptional repressor) of toxin-antitoxin stability system
MSEAVLSLTGSDSPCTLRVMKLSISQARKRLPALVRQVRRDPGATVQITVGEEAVAELRALQPSPQPGEAARKLLELRKRLARKGLKTRRRDISSHVKEHLYGPKGLLR